MFRLKKSEYWKIWAWNVRKLKNKKEELIGKFYKIDLTIY